MMKSIIKSKRSRVKSLSGGKTFLFVLMLSIASSAMDAPGMAKKGIESFKKGEVTVAKTWFTRAMANAILHAEEDWVMMSALNVIDIQLLEMDFKGADELINKLLLRPSKYTSEIYWKKSLLYHSQWQSELANEWIQKAINESDAKNPNLKFMKLDQIRMTAEKDPGTALTELVNFETTLSKQDKSLVLGLKGYILLALERYKEAGDVLQAAVNYHRKNNNKIKVAECTNYLALVEYKLGNVDVALKFNDRAVGVLSSLKLKQRALVSGLLYLYLEKNDVKVNQWISNFKSNSTGDVRKNIQIQNVLNAYEKLGQVRLSPEISRDISTLTALPGE